MRFARSQSERYTYLIMVTACDSPEDLLKAFASGVDDFLSKPVSAAQLLARLRGASECANWKSNWRRATRNWNAPSTKFGLSGGSLTIRRGGDAGDQLPQRVGAHGLDNVLGEACAAGAGDVGLHTVTAHRHGGDV